MANKSIKRFTGMDKRRIKWIDVLKFFGIFAIYLGHFGESAGYGYEFVFKFHVPIFFFIAGCTESMISSVGIIEGIKKKTKTLLIPWMVFALLSSVVKIVTSNASIEAVPSIIKLILKGTVRNSFFAYSLWFLTCLYVVSVLFLFIKKLNNHWYMLLTSLLTFVIAEKFLPHRPIVEPTIIFNIDSALYYMIYFVIGYICFERVNKVLESRNRMINVVCIISGIVAFGYTGLVYFGRDMLQIVNEIPVVGIFKPVFTALIIIWFFIIVSYILRDVAIFNSIGANTLYLCGSEYIIKTFMVESVGILSLAITFNTPLAVYVYTFVLLVIVCRYLAPIEKSLINTILNLKIR